MNKMNLTLYILSFSLLTGCASEQSVEDYFLDVMRENEKEMGEDYSYELLKQEESVVHDNDALTIYTENNQYGEQIFIAYFEKIDGMWNCESIRGAMWDDDVNWSVMGEGPYIYSGDFTDYTIDNVYVDDVAAEIMELEGNKRFWYAIVPNETAEIKYAFDDGDEESVEFWVIPSITTRGEN